ncbi:MAG: 30S ribosomal protein S6--L-glutamate ligase, partial [Myxococcota bacterium]
MRIAVLSQSIELYSTRRLVDAGRRAGHQMQVVDYMRCRIGIGGPHPITVEGEPLGPIDAFIPRIGAS